MRANPLLLSLALLAACGAPSAAPEPPRPDPEAPGVVHALDAVHQVPQVINQREVHEALRRHFPAALEQAGRSGEASFSFLVDPSGRVREIRLVESSTMQEVDAAARKVLEVMRFSPARIDGRAVWVRVVMPLSFQAR